MSARKSLPIGIILMILMMALAALGVGYAWWTEQLTATGTVQTGTIDVKMADATTAEVDPLEVADCSSEVSADGKTMTVAIKNGYPAFVCQVNFSLNNQGSVPAKITNVNFPIVNRDYGVLPSGALISKPMLNPSSPEGANFYIRVRSGAAQNANFKFDFSIEIAQGNAP